MKSRLLVAAVGVPVLLLVVLWAPIWVLSVCVVVLSVIAAYELMKCVGQGKRVELPTECCAAAAALAAWAQLIYDGFRPSYMALLVMLLVLLVFAVAVVKAGEVKLVHVLSSIFAFAAIPYAFSAFLRIEAAGYHRGFLLLPLVFSFMSDTGAYFVGITLGKHKLAPKVSPHKTVEGSVGGLLTNALSGVVFAWVMNTAFDFTISYGGMAVLGFLCSVVAQVGDLSFSLIKREFGIKDYGRIFLAHGGVLDRFDSVIFVAPVLAVLLPLLGI